MENTPLPGTGLPDRNRGPEILAVCSSLVAVSFIFLVVRFFVRIKMIKEVGWDDWFCLAAWLVVFIEMMMFIPEVKYGAGRHAAYIQPPSYISKGLKINFFTQPLCLFAVALVKVSIGLFLLRITSSTKYSKLIIGFIIFTSLASAAHILVVFFQCRPLPFTWGEGEGSCMKGSHLRFASFFNSAIGIMTDLMFALIPIPILYKLQVNWRVKVAICGILSLGIFATSAGFVKVFYMSNYGKHGDFLYDSTDLTIWTTVEICVGIIAACFPCLKPLFKAALAGSFLSKQTQSHTGYNRQDPRSERMGRSENDKEGFEMYGKFGSEGISEREMATVEANGSQDSILREVVQGEAGIRKTTQVRVDYEKGVMPERKYRI